jgi:hypothetical protein
MATSTNTQSYFVIKPTTHNRKKVTYGDELQLTESQARPLRHGGFISPDKSAADRIGELIIENSVLKTKLESESSKDDAPKVGGST